MTSNIMIVDDSLIDRKIIRQILEHRLPDISVFEAEDGLGLPPKLLENNIHLCILDIMMPQKNGFEVLNELKEDARVQEIPVIVCTGLEDKQSIERALLEGAYDYFSKPFSEEVMKISLPLKVKNAIALMKKSAGVSYLSYHDVLTGLYNRRFYEEEIVRMNVEKNLPISIIIGDINGLKLINDTFGHTEGDKLLRIAASSLQDVCSGQAVAARWGGDEFVVLLPKTDAGMAEHFIQQVKMLYADKQVNGVGVSISFGWATKSQHEENIIKVLQSAEDVMYRNKTLENESVRSTMINTIIKTLHEKNPREEAHSKRVGDICQRIGKAMALPDIEVRKLKICGLLHDIGKIAIDEGILNKPGKLTEEEYDQISRHPMIGYRILSSSHEMLELAEYVLPHHERWDGSGYPKGLSGENIPVNSRIIAIADSYDAMTSQRSYRAALSEEYAQAEIRNNAGKQFDPHIARIFIEKVLGKPWK